MPRGCAGPSSVSGTGTHRRGDPGGWAWASHHHSTTPGSVGHPSCLRQAGTGRKPHSQMPLSPGSCSAPIPLWGGAALRLLALHDTDEGGSLSTRDRGSTEEHPSSSRSPSTTRMSLRGHPSISSAHRAGRGAPGVPRAAAGRGLPHRPHRGGAPRSPPAGSAAAGEGLRHREPPARGAHGSRALAVGRKPDRPRETTSAASAAGHQVPTTVVTSKTASGHEWQNTTHDLWKIGQRDGQRRQKLAKTARKPAS